MSPGGQSNLLLIRRLLHPSTPGFDPIQSRFFAQVLPKFLVVRSDVIAHQRISVPGPENPTMHRLMRCYLVSARINRVANADEECSAPVELARVQDRLFS